MPSSQAHQSSQPWAPKCDRRSKATLSSPIQPSTGLPFSKPDPSAVPPSLIVHGSIPPVSYVEPGWSTRAVGMAYETSAMSSDINLTITTPWKMLKRPAMSSWQRLSGRGLAIDSWLVRVKQPIDPTLTDRIERAGNPDGPLAGEVLVFTGALELPRRLAADLAASVGCEVDAGVTKHTTILVVGDQDIQRLHGHVKSSKHRKAEDLISRGQPIRILRETDFRALTGAVA